MDEILKSIQNKLEEITKVKYVDEDWGQLDLFGTDIPVKFPCTLFDVKNADFENFGKDRTQIPQERQLGRFSLELSIAKMKLSNTSGKAPLSQKNNAWEIHNIIKKVHEKLQGFSPTENCSKLIRKNLQRIRRDDGVQMYRVIYDFEAVNI